ncbi:MAG: 30S ribosome-binding factor RbfA [Candidatus Lambdaproteobacteria bacterium]|nr:30S ribosome-binding factor RbfA [Candidatus Lambdaproteobacteria bacterium]
MAGRKLEHLNAVLRHKLSAILQREANDPRFAQVTISGVTLSRDKSHAQVTVSSYDPQVDADDLVASLNRAAGFFSQGLGRTLKTRLTPRVSFRYDRGFDHAQEIENLLQAVKQEGTH